MITLYKTKNRHNQLEFYTDNEWFKNEFIAIIKWNLIEFRRPSIDTRVKIRKASKNGLKWNFSMAMQDGQPGKYEIEEQDDNLIVYL